jgi:transposase InsO family protein
VLVLSRKSRSRVRLQNIDRLIFVWLYRCFPAILNAITVVKPETVIRWHRRGFRVYWRWKSRGLVILRHARRRLVSISVTNNPTAEWIAGQVTDAFPWDEAPRHLIRDRDGAFGPAYTRRIHAMGIRDHPVAPRSPWQNGHVERLIGSIRRESLDHLIVFGEGHLRGVLRAYASYYNEVRTHLSSNKDAPDFRRAQKAGRIAAMPILGGLHHQYVRV